MKEFFANKKYGFYVTLATILLAIVTLIVYVSIYSSTRYMSWEAFWIILVGAVLSVVLILLKQYRFAPALLLTANFVGMLFFIYHIYFFVSSAVVGIQFSGFPPEFFVNIVFYVLTLVVSIAAVFLPQAEEK